MRQATYILIVVAMAAAAVLLLARQVGEDGPVPCPLCETPPVTTDVAPSISAAP